MTIVTSKTSSGPYFATGQTTFAVDFQSGGVGEIEVTVNGVVVSPALYTFFRDADGTGSVVFSAGVSGTVVIHSQPSFLQQTAFNRFGAFYPDQFNEPLDRAAIRALFLRARTDRSLKLPRGLVAPDVPPLVAGKVLMAGTTSSLIWADAPRGEIGPMGAVQVNNLAIAVPTLSTAQEDQTPAINAALNNAAVGEVILPAGTFWIATPIIVPTGKGFRGAGVGVTILNLLSAASGQTGGIIQGRPGTRGVRVSDFTLNGRYIGHTASGGAGTAASRVHGIVMGGKDFVVENISVRNLFGYACWAASGTTGVYSSGSFRNIHSDNANVHLETTRARYVSFTDCTG